MRLKWDEEAVATIDYPTLEVAKVSAEEGALPQYNIRRRFEAVHGMMIVKREESEDKIFLGHQKYLRILLEFWR